LQCGRNLLTQVLSDVASDGEGAAKGSKSKGKRKSAGGDKGKGKGNGKSEAGWCCLFDAVVHACEV
jgi:hypothetical protein